MFKLAISIFVICVSVILYSLASEIPIARWEWYVTIGSTVYLLRAWFAKAARDEMIDSMYSKYDGPKKGKRPEYHGL